MKNVVPEKANVEALIKADKIVIFAYSYCYYSLQAKDVISRYTNAFKFYECDILPNGKKLRKEILKKYHHSTVPAVFINGSFIGGADMILSLDAQGKLKDMLS